MFLFIYLFFFNYCGVVVAYFPETMRESHFTETIVYTLVVNKVVGEGVNIPNNAVDVKDGKNEVQGKRVV